MIAWTPRLIGYLIIYTIIMNSIRTGCRTFPTKWKQRVHRLDFYSGFTPAAIWFEIQTMLSSSRMWAGWSLLDWCSTNTSIGIGIDADTMDFNRYWYSKNKTRILLILFIWWCIGRINWLHMFAYRQWLWWQKEAREERAVCGSIFVIEMVDVTKATCLHYQESISRGGKTSKSFNTGQ